MCRCQDLDVDNPCRVTLYDYHAQDAAPHLSALASHLSHLSVKSPRLWQTISEAGLSCLGQASCSDVAGLLAAHSRVGVANQRLFGQAVLRFNDILNTAKPQVGGQCHKQFSFISERLSAPNPFVIVSAFGQRCYEGTKEGCSQLQTMQTVKAIKPGLNPPIRKPKSNCCFAGFNCYRNHSWGMRPLCCCGTDHTFIAGIARHSSQLLMTRSCWCSKLYCRSRTWQRLYGPWRGPATFARAFSSGPLPHTYRSTRASTAPCNWLQSQADVPS